MKINPDHAQFVQDLVLRITSNPDFNPGNGNIDKACATAFAVGRKFFPLWDAERTDLEGGEPKPEPKKASAKPKVAEKRAAKKKASDA